MKCILFSALLLLGAAAGVRAQCDQKISWKASKAVFVDSSGKEERVDEAPLRIETSPGEIVILRGEGGEDRMSGPVKSFTCEWKEPFKNGKATYAADLSDAQGESLRVRLEFVAEEGKIKLTLIPENMGGRRILVQVESYEPVR